MLRALRAPRTSQYSRTFQMPCSSIGQLVVRNENENAALILDSSVPVHPTDIFNSTTQNPMWHQEIFRHEIIRPSRLLCAVRSSTRVRNSPNSPSSKRHIRTPRLRSLVPSPTGK